MNFECLDFKYCKADGLISTSVIEPFESELEIRIITTDRQKEASEVQRTALEEITNSFTAEFLSQMDDAAEVYRAQIPLEDKGINRGNIRQHYQVIGIIIPRLEIGWKRYTFLIAHPEWYDDSLMQFTIREGMLLECEEMNAQWDCIDWHSVYEEKFPD